MAPYAVLAVYFVPGALLLPTKLLALWTISQGHAGGRRPAVDPAKIGGAAIVAGIFQLTQPALMRLPWLTRLFERWLHWKGSKQGWMGPSSI